MSCVSSSSGCAPMTSTRAVVPSAAISSPSAPASARCDRARAASPNNIPQTSPGARFIEDGSWWTYRERGLSRRSGLSTASGRVRQSVPNDPGLLVVVVFLVSLGRARTLRTPDVAHRRHRPDGGAQPGLHIAPGAHVPRLFLRPHDVVDVRVQVDEVADLARPGREL